MFSSPVRSLVMLAAALSVALAVPNRAVAQAVACPDGRIDFTGVFDYDDSANISEQIIAPPLPGSGDVCERNPDDSCKILGVRTGVNLGLVGKPFTGSVTYDRLAPNTSVDPWGGWASFGTRHKMTVQSEGYTFQTDPSIPYPFSLPQPPFVSIAAVDNYGVPWGYFDEIAYASLPIAPLANGMGVNRIDARLTAYGLTGPDTPYSFTGIPTASQLTRFLGWPAVPPGEGVPPDTKGSASLHIYLCAVDSRWCGNGTAQLQGHITGFTQIEGCSSPAAMFFTDALTAPSSPNLATIPAGKYGYSAAGLQRTQSSGTTDRPMVTTSLGTYLTASNFTAEVTVNLTSPDIAYFGFGRTEPDPLYFNEPTPSFLFRVHRNWDGYSGIQAWPTTFGTGFNDPSHFFGFPAGNALPDYGGGPLTLMITKNGDTLTMSIPSTGASKTFSISQYSAAMGLNGTNARIFFGNTTVGSVFSDLKIYPNAIDTTAPVINAPASITEEATGPNGAVATFSATATDNVDATVSVTATPASGSTFPLGDTTVTLSATDAAGNIGSTTFTVTVRDRTAPVVTAPGNVTAEATSLLGAVVAFPNATATDIVGVTFGPSCSPASSSNFLLGPTTVKCSAYDAAGNIGSATFTVTVQDTTPPVITSLSTNAPTLWPPNHKMVAVTVSALARDLVGVASRKIISVTSSEPDNGLGDGDTAGDIVITGPLSPLSVNLRAERSGKGNGRTYTITVEAKDAAGNATTGTVTVSVPKSQGGR